ncbi:DUF4238 domain-containing protein [Mucilaginibacter conchicola]|uniref:DUF4238 domain-containing protein n=1 Tax=Mucilaginibacter conchicola TaxID=2303333 RepID=A0A372NWS1_9SPHI|nr:DUF4238 domain-containing protein [Mucilaginibacter conchicola]RFZ94139.1 DUF4238 domain-containing protein [Mucilaginibacter conchicola]
MVKNQHYVPRFYLKHFLDENGKCLAFHKDSQKVFSTNPQSMANENFFYDHSAFDDALGTDQPVEKYLSQVEELYAPFLKWLLDAIDNREIISLNEDMRAILCDLVMFQIIRTKAHRENMFQGFRQFQDKLVQSGWLSEEMITEMRKDNTADRAKQSHLEQLFFDTEFKESLIKILDSHIWLVFKNITNTPYYTSDHPVVKTPHLRREHRSDNGYRSEGIEIAMPLSSTHLLVLVERTMFKQYEAYENEVLIHSDVQHIIYYNAMQVSQSYRAVYCVTDQFELAKEMVTTHPELQQLDHDRFGVE